MTETRLECVRKEIRSVLIISKNGLTFEEFRRSYRSLVGVSLPSREFGHISDIEFLYSLPDVVHVQVDSNGKHHLYGIADESTEHIQKLVQKQKNPRTNSKNNTNSIKLNHHILSKNNNFKFRNQIVSENASSKCEPFMPAKLKHEILQLMKQYPDGIGYSSLMVAYQNAYKKKLNIDWLSNIPKERFRKLADVIPELEWKVTMNAEKIHYLCHQKNETNDKSVLESHCKPFRHKAIETSSPSTSPSFTTSQAVLSQLTRQQSDLPIIPLSVKCNFEKVLKHCPNGILAVYFPVLYEKITNMPLDIHGLGFTSLLEIADALPDIFFYIQAPDNLKDVILFHQDCSKNIPKLKGSIPRQISYNPLEKLPPYLFKTKKTLYDIAPPKLRYLPAELSEASKDEFINVFVSSARNPSLFWFQIQSEETVLNFSELERQMKSFYDQHSYDYKLAKTDVLIGSSCVAFSSDENHWYRVLITALPDVNYANVFFVDYGNWTRIHTSMLYYLRYSFIAVPVNAHRAKLSSIIPSNKVWSIKACERFLSSCNVATLMAKIELVCDGTLSVFLCDMSGSEEIYINDILVDEGFAVADFLLTSSSQCNGNIFKQNSETNSLPGHHQITQQHLTQVGSFNDEIQAQGFHSGNFQVKKENKNSRLQPKCLFHEPSLVKKRFVKKACLGDGYKIHIIVVSDEAYVSAGDLCDLFWKDKEADVLPLRLKFQRDVDIPALTIFEEEFKELFLQCIKYSVKGFIKTQRGNSLVLYPLKNVMTILNIFGHPSLNVRKCLLKEIENFDPHDKIWTEFQETNEDILKYSTETENTQRKPCLYDLKVRLEALRYKKIRLTTEMEKDTSNENYCIAEIERIESMQRLTVQQMEEIKTICSMYASSSK